MFKDHTSCYESLLVRVIVEISAQIHLSVMHALAMIGKTTHRCIGCHKTCHEAVMVTELAILDPR